MKKHFISAIFISATLLLAGCSTQDVKETSAETDVTAATSSIDYTQEDIVLLTHDLDFRDVYLDAVSEESMEKYSLDLSAAYIGTPYALAVYSENGSINVGSDMQFNYPIVTNDKAMLIIAYRTNGANMLYHAGTDTYYTDALNSLLSSGKKYALVVHVMPDKKGIDKDADIVYAVSEEDEVILLHDADNRSESLPDISFEEASQFGNIISLESLTTQVYP